MGERLRETLAAGRTECEFSEKYQLLGRGEALSEASRCYGCHNAPCIEACPTTIDIPSFIEKIASENKRGAARVILDANLLGASCAQSCPVEVLCEGACVYKHTEKPAVSIGRLQRYAMHLGGALVELDRAPSTGYSVACVGSGPASLACAGRLALLGHAVVMYEKGDVAGGLGVSGVAPYKINAAEALDEVDFILSLGVELKTGVNVGVDVTADELFEEHGAVFCGVGLGTDRRLPVVHGANECVTGAVEWIASMKLGAVDMAEFRRVAVIGGGNTALDAARELAQLGAESVHLIYRRSDADMSGYLHEWNLAKSEGVVLIPNAVLTSIDAAGAGGLALTLSCAEAGRPTDAFLPSIEVDHVLVAIGQEGASSVGEIFGDVRCDDRGRVLLVDDEGATHQDGVFAGGDAANGGREVVNAVDEGQRAAIGIHKYLMGGNHG